MPAAVDVAVRNSFVAVLRKERVAPGTIAPLGSATTPETVPLNCAYAAVPKVRSTHRVRREKRRLVAIVIDSLQMWVKRAVEKSFSQCGIISL
jgi:hypothetical protein